MLCWTFNKHGMQYMKGRSICIKTKRKYKETDGKIRQVPLGYYAQMIANNPNRYETKLVELEQEYPNMYGKTMFENFADGKKKGKSNGQKRAGASCKKFKD